MATLGDPGADEMGVGTWNARSMNQGKLEVVKQEMARVNIDILGISQTTQGNRLSCRDQEGRRGSEEAVPGPSAFQFAHS